MLSTQTGSSVAAHSDSTRPSWKAKLSGDVSRARANSALLGARVREDRSRGSDSSNRTSRICLEEKRVSIQNADRAYGSL